MGNKNTDKKHRQRLRPILLAQGVPADEVERIIAAVQREQLAKRHPEGVPTQGAEVRERRARPPRTADRKHYPAAVVLTDDSGPKCTEYLDLIQEETYARLGGNDARFRPTSVDPLLRGQARVSAATARAARRKLATRKTDYDQETA